MPTLRRPTAVDLFAGAGGLSLGLEMAGFDVLAALEYDPVHAATHAWNFPQTEVLCHDASQVTIEEMKATVKAGWELHHPGTEWDGTVDLVAGGPPCQGFSFIGKRRVDDDRNDLIFHYFRLVNGLRPTHFVMENVPGMLSGKHRDLLDDLIKHFEDAGYVVQKPQVLNAAHYGTPQDRRRVILMGSLKGHTPAVHPHPTHNPPRAVRTTLPVSAADLATLPAGPTVWDAIGDLPDLDRFKALSLDDCVKLSATARKTMDTVASPYAKRLMGAVSHAAPRKYDRNVLTSSMRTEHTATTIARFKATEQGEVEKVSRFLRLPEDGLCNTLRAGSGGEHGAFTSPRPIHPRLSRVISVREAARLHGFPDWFRFHVTKWNGFRQVGNSVCPPLGEAIGREVTKALDVTPAGAESVELPRDTSLLRLSMKEAASTLGASHSTIPRSRRRPNKEVPDGQPEEAQAE